ncbi:S-layer homology domain-containing protein [Paenibacillus athensensis]|nr:S-layer homology domain-containing protein [Paenibacillus athensensis]MCD1260355.1 S-layer homology domain-containing protein [Paenibacillus athensensis]
MGFNKSRTFCWLSAALLTVQLVVPGLPAAADEVWTEVDTPAELSAMRNDLAGHYRLTHDIDLAGYDDGDGDGWRPVGNSVSPFTGKLDGNGFVIRHMTIDRINDNYVGLFGTISGAELANVHLSGAVVKGNSIVGGIAGMVEQSSLTLSSFEGRVTGSGMTGGLVGYNSLSRIADSYAQGSVIVGASPTHSFGGLIGYSAGNTALLGGVERSYATAAVGAGTDTGGLIGRKDGFAPVTSSYWDISASGQAGSAAGTGHFLQEMKQKATYAGWDFTGSETVDPVWGLIELATYPLHYNEYRKVALSALTVKDADDAVQPLDRAFSSDYGVYSARVVSRTDHVVVTGVPLSPSSDVAVDGGAATNTLALLPGANDFDIQVSDPDDPARLKAVYKLTIYRDAGTAMYPHRLTTAVQLAHIGDAAWGYSLDQTYELDADLDLSGYTSGAGWSPIGSEAEPFTGVFNGNDHTIAHLKIDRPSQDGAGLFGYTSGAAVSGLALPDADVRGRQYAGSLIGRAEQTAVSAVSALGSVAADSDAGGLIGAADALTTVSESLAAAQVAAAGGGAGGLIGSGAAPGAVTHAFWDAERSGQSTSAGGGSPQSTADMMREATYTGYGGSVWAFGSGHRWGLTEGAAYPMPWASFVGASPAGLTVTAPGTTATLTPTVFDPAQGVYTAALAAPVAQAEVTVTPTAGQAVAINGTPGATALIGLHLGDNAVGVEVTGANGAATAYRLNVAVPAPVPAGVQAPPNGKYGIGAELSWVVAYDFAVEVDAAHPPSWTIQLDGGATVEAVYQGKFAGEANKLLFGYTVREGDTALSGAQPAASLVAAASTAVTALGDPVPLTLPAPLPDTSGVVVDGVAPLLALTPSTTAPTAGPVAIDVAADGTGTGIDRLKWAKGVRDAAYFAAGGSDVTGMSVTANDNGSYTVYAADEAGNETVETISIANIATDKPTIALDFTPKGKTRWGVDVTVAAVASGAGNSLQTLRWAAGSLTEADFASPVVGADVPPSGMFHVTANGSYTVYAADTAGNEQTAVIDIANIGETAGGSAGAGGAPSVPAAGAGAAKSFTVLPGIDYALELDGLTVRIPAGALAQTATVTLADMTAAAEKLLPDDRVRVSGVYEVTKDVPGLFAIPVQLELALSDSAAGAGGRPVLAYYNEQSKAWIEMGGTTTGSVLTGKTDHFTKFAVFLTAAEAEPVPTPDVSFSDIRGHWAEAAIRDGAGRGWIDGYPDGAFRPDEPVTRAEFALMLERALSADGDAAEAADFRDGPLIPGWARAAVARAVRSGWIDGYPDGTFRPAAFISRTEAAVLIARAGGAETPAAAAPFADDAAIADWAKPYIEAAREAKLVEGQAGGRFEPDALTTRAEAVVWLLRVSAYVNGAE